MCVSALKTIMNVQYLYANVCLHKKNIQVMYTMMITIVWAAIILLIRVQKQKHSASNLWYALNKYDTLFFFANRVPIIR